jgi:hypothetical protein
MDQLEKLQLRRQSVAGHRPAFPKEPKLPNEPNLKTALPVTPASREGQLY